MSDATLERGIVGGVVARPSGDVTHVHPAELAAAMGRRFQALPRESLRLLDALLGNSVAPAQGLWVSLVAFSVLQAL